MVLLFLHFPGPVLPHGVLHGSDLAQQAKAKSMELVAGCVEEGSMVGVQEHVPSLRPLNFHQEKML